MIRTILVPSMGDDGDERRYRTALFAARLFDAHLEFLHICLEPADILAAATTAGVGAALRTPELVAALAEEDRKRATQARVSCESFCEREKVPLRDAPGAPSLSAEWHMAEGDEIEHLVWRARFSDLLVLSRAKNGRGLSAEAIGGMLVGCGRPLLLAPDGDPPAALGKIIVAWKDVPESARALGAALPFLRLAAQIVVVTVDEGAPAADESLEILTEQLGWHGFTVTGKRVAAQRGHGAEALMATARELGADLLVMGGYGHSRTRELMFGGFTRHVLAGADVPVLLAH